MFYDSGTCWLSNSWEFTLPITGRHSRNNRRLAKVVKGEEVMVVERNPGLEEEGKV